MAWYNYGYYGRRYRRHWYRRRRPRGPFRRRRYFKRRVRKRNFKLKKIPILQWQPPSIRKCHIKGLECLCLFNQNRLPFNSTMYKDSYVPEGFPGGGGFTVMKFTLNNLYSMHKFCSNWWTQTNDNLPLCRYLGCKIKCYASSLIDYVIKYSTSQPAVSNKLTYPSTQPSMMMMSSQKRIIPSTKTRPRKKPYTVIRVKPPPKLENKWYFQRDMQETPLLILYAAPTSLQNYYINPNSDNNNITITSINTSFIQNRDFQLQHWPYKHTATDSFYIYEYIGNKPHSTPSEFENQYLIPLTDVKNYTIGSSFYQAKTTYAETLTNYCSHISKYTGNPFTFQSREKESAWFYSKTGPQTWADQFKTKGETSQVKQIMDGTQQMALSIITEPLIKKYRYNPFKDDGKTTKIYLLKCNEQSNSWDPPENPDIILEGFPLWLAIWGYVDFQIRLGTYTNIYTNTMLVIQNKTLHPNDNKPIVPIDLDYLNNKSPYENTVNEQDRKRWYPQVQYQTQQINQIALTGPGTTKLYEKTSEQIVIKYDFYFKWGGNPAKMVNVANPAKQIIYPMPSDQYETNSLQSPAQAIETVLYSFDQRNNELTKKALERISKDWDITELLSSFTETTGVLPAQPTYPQDPQEKEAQKKEKEKILQQLIEQRNQQQQLRLGIINLMKQLDL
nr:MAG: ORF1 [TTV-like mini virus]